MIAQETIDMFNKSFEKALKKKVSDFDATDRDLVKRVDNS
jgi:hypothetical protein